MTLANELQALGAFLGLLGSLMITIPSLTALNNQKQSIRAGDLQGGNDATRELIGELKAGLGSDAKVVVARLACAHIVGLLAVSLGFLSTLAGLVVAG